MKYYTLTTSQSFPLKLDEVFSFFSRPENLGRITPPNLNFKIIKETPISMKEGEIIDYKISISLIPLRWKTLISEYNPPYKFVDEQIQGPYSLWIHSHDFEYKDGLTIVTDTVKYKPPFYFIGDIINKIYIKNMLNQIFEYRFYKIAEIFKEKYPNFNIQNEHPKVTII